jgi:hypothetical protein
VPRRRFLPVEHAHRGRLGLTLTDFELASADSPFDVNLAAFLWPLVANSGEFSITHDLVPLDAFLPLALLIGEWFDLEHFSSLIKDVMQYKKPNEGGLQLSNSAMEPINHSGLKSVAVSLQAQSTA